MTLPLNLYKYRSLQGDLARKHTKATLLNQQLYFALHTEFNDLFDCNIHISPTADPVTCTSRLRELNPEMSDAEIDALVQRELSSERVAEIDGRVRDAVSQELARMGILSLSAKADDLLMWSYYADGHRGVCLQFALRDGKLFGCDVTEVHYEKQYPSLSVYDELTLDWVRRYLSTKARAWEHEEEWRILWQKPGVNQFPAEDLSGLIFGARVPPRDRAEILGWIAASRATPALYQAQPKVASFGVDIVPFEDVGGGDRPTTA